MKSSSTTTAMVGGILAATGSATPIYQNPASAAASTSSFGPEYTNVAGTFTAIAGHPPTPTTTPASSSAFAFLGGSAVPILDLGPGHEVLDSGIPEILTTPSTSTVGTPIKTSVTSSATASLFPDFHPHFGHGPVVPGREFNSSRKTGRKPKNRHPHSRHGTVVHGEGFNHNSQTSNSTAPKLTSATVHLTFDDLVNPEFLPHTGYRYSSMRSMCEKYMSMEKWRRWRFSDEKHSSDKVHHNSIQGRDLSSTVVSPYRELYPDSRPAKDSADSAPAAPKVIDIACARRELDEKIQEQNNMIDYYRHLIAEMEDDINDVKKHKSKNHGSSEKATYIHNAEIRMTHKMEELKKAKVEKGKLVKERKLLGDILP